jgi:hypothetical protein
MCPLNINIMSENNFESTTRDSHEQYSNNEVIFSQLLKCSHCGFYNDKGMYRDTRPGDEALILYLVCKNCLRTSKL